MRSILNCHINNILRKRRGRERKERKRKREEERGKEEKRRLIM